MNGENNKIEVLIKLLIGVVIIFLICLLVFVFLNFKKDFSNNASDKPNGIDNSEVLCKAKEKAIAGQFTYGDKESPSACSLRSYRGWNPQGTKLTGMA